MFGVLGLNPWECTAYYVSERLPACSIAPCRRPVGGGPITSNKPAGPRRYGDDEVRELLERATRLEQATEPENEPSEDGVTLAELEEAAAEAGIRPRYVRRAAALLSNPGARARFGVLRRTSPHRSIQGEIGDEDWNALTVEMERIVGPGTVMVTSGPARGSAGPGKTLQWLSTNRRSWICMTSGAGETGIWVGDYLAGFLGPVLGGSAAGTFIALSISGGFLGLVGAVPLGALMGWGIARLANLAFKPMVARIERSEALDRLVERVAGYARPENELPGE